MAPCPESPATGAPSSLSPCSHASSQLLSFKLNGETIFIKDPDPQRTLASYLRDEAGLTGTKISCNEGGCGACTVVLSGPPLEGFRPVNACLRPLCSMHGLEVTTVEGLGSQKRGLHAVQREIVRRNGTQCGFCTPGMVMSYYSLLRNDPRPTSDAIEAQLDGNLCRCTGFRPILDAGQAFACTKACSRDIEELCPSKPPSNPTLPPCKPLLSWATNDCTWLVVQSLPQLYSILHDEMAGDSRIKHSSGVRLVAGNTSTGVYDPPKAGLLIDIAQIPELRSVTVGCEGIGFGGGVTIAELMKSLEENRGLSSMYGPLLLHLKRVAQQQVRNAGSIAGNLMMAHAHPDFSSDLATIFMAAGAVLKCGSAQTRGQTTRVSITQFFALEPKGLVIEEVFLPALGPEQKLVTHKVALRRQHAHALVNMGMRVAVTPEGVFAERPTIIFGGVAGRAFHATNTEAFLQGKEWEDDTVLQGALTVLSQEAVVDPHGLHAAHRQSLVTALFYKAYLALQDAARLPQRLLSAAVPYERPVSSGSVTFDQDLSEFPVSKPLHKLGAEVQATGEAQYLDDLHLRGDELHAAFVLSTQADATIDEIDPAAALSMRGVKGFISADTLTRDGYGHLVGPHECLFACKKVDYYGQAIGLIVADTKKHASAAASAVKVSYQDVGKPILTVQEAIKACSFLPDTYRMEAGDVGKAFAGADVIVEGEVSLGHTYHFHLETQRAQATPGEGGTISIVSSTQNPSQVQAIAANILNRAQHKVKVSVKRVGGAFGGKINRATPIAAATAVAADKFGRPVRTVLGLHTNMQMVGGRPPFYVKYKIGATKDGTLTGVRMKIYQDQGYTYDCDAWDRGDFLCFFETVYRCPNWRLDGWVARTNLPACTFMRAPGTMEGTYVVETCIEHVAHALGLPSGVVRDRNLYNKGDVTPFGQPLSYCNARLVYDKVKESSGYEERVTAVDEFNAANRWVKRGISLVPTKFVAAWAGYPISALVNIYPDGSTRLDTSGVEMGQGLNIKIAQVASYALGALAVGGLPMEWIHVGTTTTVVANNTHSTDSSIGSELSCKAVNKACEKIAEGLRIAHRACLLEAGARAGEPTWQQLIGKAVELGVDLQTTARVDEEPPAYGPFQYMSYGAAVSEAEVDVLTGEWRILRADVLLDCGKSLNPAIDVGQVQGGFVMGLGNFLCEEMLYDADGKNVTDSTWQYKVPSAHDIPIEFHVSLLQNAGNPHGFLRSKCSGEPPTALAASANLAIRSAVACARAERGDTSWFSLNSPATVEKIALASKAPKEQLTLKP